MTESKWVSVGSVQDIPSQGARVVTTPVGRIAVFKTEQGSVYALEDRCPHENGPLSQGIVHGECVTCPLHNWVIALDSGLVQGADEGSVRTVTVRLDGDEISLDLSILQGQVEAVTADSTQTAA